MYLEIPDLNNSKETNGHQDSTRTLDNEGNTISEQSKTKEEQTADSRAQIG